MKHLNHKIEQLIQCSVNMSKEFKRLWNNWLYYKCNQNKVNNQTNNKLQDLETN